MDCRREDPARIEDVLSQKNEQIQKPIRLMRFRPDAAERAILRTSMVRDGRAATEFNVFGTCKL